MFFILISLEKCLKREGVTISITRSAVSAVFIFWISYSIYILIDQIFSILSMRFLSLIDFFSFSNKLVVSISNFITAINNGSLNQISSSISAVTVILISGMLIGFASESKGDAFFQSIVFMIVLVIMSALVNPLNLVFGQVNTSYVIARAKGFLTEYLFIFLLLIASTLITRRFSSR